MKLGFGYSLIISEVGTIAVTQIRKTVQFYTIDFLSFFIYFWLDNFDKFHVH